MTNFTLRIHPSKCELLTGMTVDDVFQRVGANHYEATLDEKNQAHRNLFHRWLPVQTIDILEHEPEWPRFISEVRKFILG